MIRYLEHKSIDFVRWDQCVQQSVNTRVYALSWYLDRVSPGWDALVDEDYESVFPLTKSRKFGIRYLHQPFFTQQLGIFSQKLLTADLVHHFLEAIPAKFSFAEICLNSMNKVDPERYRVVMRSNFELDLIPSYEKRSHEYNQNTRRNLKKAVEANLVIQRKVDPDELIALFIDNFGKREGKLKFRHYEALRKLIGYCLEHTFSRIIGIRTADDHLCAGVFLLQEKERVTFHFAASGAAARENGAMFLLVDSVIRENSGKQMIFDFEGSSDPNVARFYQGFGAKEVTYPLVTLSRLPGILENTVKFVKKVR